MGKKQNIVVVNEFTNKSNSSKGGSINRYISEYMARDDATNVYYPLNRTENFAEEEDERSILQSSTRKRRKYVEQAIQESDELDKSSKKREFYNPLEGVAFGRKGISYTEEELRESSDEFQNYFEGEHTIFKTIISFRTEYLKEMNILSPSFSMSGEGSLQGQADQMKLRLAIDKGVQHLEKRAEFDALDWIGTLQFDTNHVHAHLVLSETSDTSKRKHHFNQYTKKLEEKGKLTSYEMMSMRTGIERALQKEHEMLPYTRQENDLKNELKSFEHEMDISSNIATGATPLTMKRFNPSENDERAMKKVEECFEKKATLPLQSIEYVKLHIQQLKEMKFLEKSKRLFKKVQLEMTKLYARINEQKEAGENEEEKNEGTLNKTKLRIAASSQKTFLEKQRGQSNEQIQQFCDVILRDSRITNIELLKVLYRLRDNPDTEINKAIFKVMNQDFPMYYQGVSGRHLQSLLDSKNSVKNELSQDKFIRLSESVENASMNAFRAGDISVDEYIDRRTALLIIQGDETADTSNVWIDQTNWTEEKNRELYKINARYIQHIQSEKQAIEEIEKGNNSLKNTERTHHSRAQFESENDLEK